MWLTADNNIGIIGANRVLIKRNQIIKGYINKYSFIGLKIVNLYKDLNNVSIW